MVKDRVIFGRFLPEQVIINGEVRYLVQEPLTVFFASWGGHSKFWLVNFSGAFRPVEEDMIGVYRLGLRRCHNGAVIREPNSLYVYAIMFKIKNPDLMGELMFEWINPAIKGKVFIEEDRGIFRVVFDGFVFNPQKLVDGSADRFIPFKHHTKWMTSGDQDMAQTVHELFFDVMDNSNYEEEKRYAKRVSRWRH